jgi:hypothetical protein
LLILLIVVVIIVLQFISLTLSPLGWKDTAAPLVLIITFVRDGAPAVPIGIRDGLSIKVTIKCRVSLGQATGTRKVRVVR